MYSFINCTCHQILLELKKKGKYLNGWVMHIECDMRHAYRVVRIP